jgi:hypothetical protein
MPSARHFFGAGSALVTLVRVIPGQPLATAEYGTVVTLVACCWCPSGAFPRGPPGGPASSHRKHPHADVSEAIVPAGVQRLACGRNGRKKVSGLDEVRSRDCDGLETGVCTMTIIGQDYRTHNPTALTTAKATV